MHVSSYANFSYYLTLVVAHTIFGLLVTSNLEVFKPPMSLMHKLDPILDLLRIVLEILVGIINF